MNKKKRFSVYQIARVDQTIKQIFAKSHFLGWYLVTPVKGSKKLKIDFRLKADTEMNHS